MSFFTSKIHDFVRKQIILRQNKMFERDSETLSWLNSKSVDIRLTSSVNIESEQLSKYFKTPKGNSLAKIHVLEGGELFFDEKHGSFRLRSGLGDGGGSYGDKTNATRSKRGSIQPMSGITNVSINSLSNNGTLQTATIDIVVNSIEELERLEVLYFSLGYTCLLEISNTVFFSNDGKYRTTYPKYNILDDNNLSKEQIFSDIFSTSDNELTAKNKIKLVENSSGNYLPCYMYVKNFRWSNVQGSDQSYNVSIDLVSIGEILNSLRVNYISKLNLDGFLKLDDSQKTSITKDSGKSKLHGVLSIIREHIRNEFDEQNTGKNLLKYGLTDVDTIGAIRFLGGYVGTLTDPSNPQLETFKSYIKFDDFIEILNNKILLSTDKKTPYLKLSLKNERGEDLTMFAHYLQIPTNLNICYIESCKNIDLLRYRLNLTDGSEQNDDNKFFTDDKYNKGLLKNIYLNIDFLIEAIEISKKDGDVNFGDYIEHILKNINESLGYINDFRLITEATSNVVRIIDSTFNADKITKDNLLTIELSGTKSIVRNYTMESSVYPTMANMITISAGVNSGGETGINTSTFDIFNKGLSDRIIKQKIEPESNTSNSVDKIIDKATQNAKTIEDVLGQYVTKLNQNDMFISLDYGNVPQALKELISLEIQLQSQVNGNDLHSSAGILPIKLKIIMDGISGFKVGDCFKVPDNMLPIRYRGFGNTTKIGFVITRIGHTVSDNVWLTNLETQTIVLDSDGKYTPVTKCKIYEYSPLILQNFGQQRRNVEFYAPFLTKPLT